MFWTHIFLGPKIIWTQNYFGTIFLGTENCLGPKTILDQIFFKTKYVCNFTILFEPKIKHILNLECGTPSSACFKIICLISIATHMLEDLDIFHLKCEINSSIWSTKTFLYEIREPRYKQIKMGYQIVKKLLIGF